MLRFIHRIIVLISLFLALSSPSVWGQFRNEAFTQSYNDDADTTGRDSTDAAFTFKEYFGGLTHKRPAKIGVMFAGSTVLVGGQQIYNKQYWKLPIIYGGLAATAGAGIYFRHQYNKSGDSSDKTISNLCFIGTGLVYWGALLDGVGNYDRGKFPQPGKATLYSILLPGLGQAYNGEYWKIPVYYTGLMVSGHLFITNNTNYRRYRRIYNEASSGEYDGPIAANSAKYYRDVFRRYRDYSAVALLGFYLLQVIDANVFAYMHDFELSDDLSMSISPAVLTPGNAYAMTGSGVGNRLMYSGGNEAFGVSIGFRF